jgi:uncharacterized protein YndB with AHSA1/START domain
MRLQIRYDYPAGPDEVFAMLTDPEFLRAKLEARGDTDVVVDECGPTADGFRVVTRRTVAVDVPGFAKKLLRPTNLLTQTDLWSDPAPDGSRTSTWQVEAKGVPVAMAGTYTLRGGPGGTVGELDGEVTSSVPLVGGRFAAFVAKEAEGNLDKEHAFALQWLAARTG